MDGLLMAVTASKPTSDHIVEVIRDTTEARFIEKQDVEDLTNPEQIIGVLQTQPDRQHVLRILRVLDPADVGAHLDSLDIRVPSPVTARILQLLVGTTIPSLWRSLDESTTPQDRKARAALLRCLSSVAGLNSLLTQLRTLITSSRAAAGAAGSSSHAIIRDLLAVISALLMPHDFTWRLYTELCNVYQNEIQKQVAWKELIALLAASRVLSIAAEALYLIRDSDKFQPSSWLGDGQEYAAWIGGNILHFVLKVEVVDEPGWAAVASFLGRSLNLGHIDPLVKAIYSGLLVSEDHDQRFRLLLNKLRTTEKIAVTEAIFRDVQKTYLPDDLVDKEQSVSTETIGGIVTLCSTIVEDQEQLRSQVVEWLATGHGGSIRTIGLRRALVATLAQHEDTLRNFIFKCFESFGDKLYIQHSPVLVQNSNAQALLLGAGYLHRQDPASLEDVGRSSIFLNSISNHLAASSTRSRFLGMIVGMAVSKMIEEPGKAMRFDLEELDTDEAGWYLELPNVEDKSCNIRHIRPLPYAAEKSKVPQVSARSKTASRPRVAKPSVKIVAIDEINSSDDEEEDDLLPYEKPDDDPSDSDDDPTLVQRVKPTAPVYIRDLISYLRDTDNVERFDLAVETSPSLIRRKTGFGTELLEHLDELSLVLVGLQDVSKNPKFHELKLQSMIAVIVAAPVKMGKWFASMYFDGDISQAQRSAVLTALGLSARELAGNAEEDARILGLTTVPEDTFPSKKLPPALENFYSTDESPVTSLAKQISRTSLQPLAAQAADSVSGPNALKVRTFSSRMEVEKRRQERDAQRQKATVRDLHKVLSEGFFFPLKGRFEMMMIQFSNSTTSFHNPFLIPHILCLFLQTLTLILSTMGPHNPFLPTLTDETLSLILSLHTTPMTSEPGVLASLLSMFLAVVDLNIASGVSGEERLMTQFAGQVIELREWAGDVFDRMPAARGADASGDPHEQVRIVAAGVMVKLGEVTERYQGRLMGINTGFKF